MDAVIRAGERRRSMSFFLLPVSSQEHTCIQSISLKTIERKHSARSAGAVMKGGGPRA
jgi:hypothetical protein